MEKCSPTETGAPSSPSLPRLLADLQRSSTQASDDGDARCQLFSEVLRAGRPELDARDIADVDQAAAWASDPLYDVAELTGSFR
jgi:hypothetical protein